MNILKIDSLFTIRLSHIFRAKNFVLVFILFSVFKTLLSPLIPAILVNLLSITILFLVFCNSFKTKLTQAQSVLLLLFLWNLFLLIKSLVFLGEGVQLVFVFIGFLQFTVPIMFMFTLISLPKNSLSFLAGFIKKIVFFLTLISFVEIFLVPNSVKLQIFDFFLKSKLNETVSGLALKDTTFKLGWNRPGSLLFEPLSFAMIVVSVLLFLWSKKFFAKREAIKRFFFFTVVFLSGVKSAIGTLFFATFFKTLRSLSFFAIITFLIFCGFMGSESFYSLLEGERVAGYESVSNHLIGLIYGVKNSMNKPFLGNGFGSAGYLIWIRCKDSNTWGPFLNPGLLRALMNGNESGMGILVYQAGIVYGLALCILFFKVFKWFFLRNDMAMAALSAGLFLFFLLSESSLAFSIQAVAFPLFAFRYKEYQSLA